VDRSPGCRRGIRRTALRRAGLGFCLLAALESPSTGQSATDYYPLATGSRWTYSVIVTGGLFPFKEGSSVTTVEGEETHGGRRYFRVRTIFTGVGIPADLQLLRRGAEGIYKLESDREQLMMPLPLKPGLKWTTRGLREEVIRHVVDGSETVDLPSDSYQNCFKVTHTSISAKSSDYFAPGVGLVKTVGAVAGSKLEFFLDTYTR
jgi:hypothetical protein